MFSAIPSVGALVLHFIMGPLFDYIRVKQLFSLTVIRKSFHIVGTLGPAAMMFAVFNMNSDHKYLIISLITIGVSLTEVTMMGGFYYALMDVAPEYSGILQGIKNTVGLSTGFIVPMIVSFLTPTETAEEWGYVFIMFGSVFSVAGLIFTLTGSSDRLNWTRTESCLSINTAE